MNLETNDFFYQKTCIHKDLEKTSYSAGKTGSKRPDKYLVVRNNRCNLSQFFFQEIDKYYGILTKYFKVHVTNNLIFWVQLIETQTNQGSVYCKPKLTHVNEQTKNEHKIFWKNYV